MAGLGPPIHDFDFGVALTSWMLRQARA